MVRPSTTGRSTRGKKKGGHKSPPEVSQLVGSTQPDSCAFVALSSYTGVPLLEVAQLAARLYPRRNPQDGLRSTQALRLLRTLGFQTKRILVEEDSTLSQLGDLVDDVEVAIARFDGHCCLLRRGLLFEPDLKVWPLDVWLKNNPGERLAELWIPETTNE